MPDEQGPLLGRDGIEGSEIGRKRSKRWVLVAMSATVAVASQSAGILLVRFYYAEGGSSKWLITLAQTAAFPLLFFVPIRRETRDGASIPVLVSTYALLGALFGGSTALFSTGLSYLSASTYSLLCSTQLAFIALFSRLINSQSLTPAILNSVVLVSLSASLVAVDNRDDSPGASFSGWERLVGICSTVSASAVYSLMFSLSQLAFQRVFPARESFSVVVEMQAYVSLVATFGSLVGLFASGEWKSLGAEMDGFRGGRVSYALTLVFTALTWQVYFICSTGLIFLVSSLFLSVISALSLVVNPIAAVIVFRDKFGAVKLLAFLTAVWGFASYVYQNILDESNGDRSSNDDIDESQLRGVQHEEQ